MTDYLDSDTVLLALIISALEERTSTDAVTIRLTFTPSGVEQRISTDAATASIRFTVTATEYQAPVSPNILAQAAQKWSLVKVVRKWDSSSLPLTTTKKWKVTYVGKVSDVLTG